MDKDEALQLIPLIEEKLSRLILLCQQHSGVGVVPMNIRDAVESILTQERRTLDKIVHAYFVKNIFPITMAFVKHKTFFPFCRSSNNLDIAYKQINIPSLKTLDSKLFSLLDKIQPYQPDFEWLFDIQTYSNLGHNTLIAVVKHNSIEGISTGGINIISPNMTLKYVRINNIFIRELKTVNGEIVSGDIDEEVKKILNIKYHYYVQGTKLDVLLLCKQGLELIKLMAQNFL